MTTAQTEPFSPLSKRTGSNGVLNSRLSIARARSIMIAEARKSLRRWITVTLLENFDRKIASSIAVSPPPTTIVVFSRKNAASQVAQYETPRAASSSSPGMPSFFGSAPIARTRARARYSSSPTQTRWTPPSFDSSIFETSSVMKRSSPPKRTAWSRNFCIISGPMRPSGKPG